MIMARQIADAAVDAMAPGDLAAIVTTGGGVPQNLTSDRARLHKTIASSDWSQRLSQAQMDDPIMAMMGMNDAMGDGRCLCGLCVMDTIAHTRGEYVDIAFRLASDREFMRTVKERIHRALAASMLTDIRGHTRNLERAYIAAIAARAPGVLEHDRHEARAIG